MGSALHVHVCVSRDDTNYVGIPDKRLPEWAQDGECTADCFPHLEAGDGGLVQASDLKDQRRPSPAESLHLWR